MDVDYVAASFVRSGRDVEELRTLLNDNGGKKIKIISKIENMEGISNFHDILRLSDGIMVARGDMGVEVDFEKLRAYREIHQGMLPGRKTGDNGHSDAGIYDFQYVSYQG